KVARAARGQQVQAAQLRGSGITQLSDQLRTELALIASGDDRDLHALQQLAQECRDTRVDRALGRREGVVEVEGDEADAHGGSIVVMRSCAGLGMDLVARRLAPALRYDVGVSPAEPALRYEVGGSPAAPASAYEVGMSSIGRLLW